MFCTRCGTKNSDGATYCAGCGMALQAAPGQPAAQPVVYGTVPGANFVPPPAGYAYAGFWLRFVAAFLDGLLLMPVVFIVGIGLAILFPVAIRDRQADALFTAAFFGIYLGVALLVAVANWLYHTLMESSAQHQATLGKKVLHIVVTDLNGNRISFARANGRFFGKILSGLAFNIGYIMAGFTQRKQALHDMIADCLVLRRL